MSRKKKYILLFLIIAVAFYLRIANINNTPPGVYPDEAVNGIDAMNALEYGKWQWFYEANNGREGLFMNLIALCFNFFGVSVLALKLPSIICGTLAALGTYLLAKELFKSARVGLISSFLVATSFWAINFSRISFRANMLPFVLVFAFYFLMRGMNTKKYWHFAVSGMFFGLGFHTYIAYRIAPLIFFVMFVLFFFTRERFARSYFWRYVVLGFFTLLVASPMFYTFYTHPEYITSRTGNVSIFNPEINQGHFAMTFLKTFGLSLAKYNFWGDQNWRHNFPPYPLLDPITGIAFTFALVYVVIKIFHILHLRFFRKFNHPHFEAYMLLLSWLFIMLVPEFMAAEGNPHALRSIGTLPAVFILSALTFEYFFKKSEEYSYIHKKVSALLVISMLLIIGVFNAAKYHLVWAQKPETAQSFDQNLMDISNHIKSLPKNEDKFVIIESMQRIPIQLFNWENPHIFYFYPGEADQIIPQNENFEIILTDKNDEIITSLETRFPNLQYEERKDKFGLSFYILK